MKNVEQFCENFRRQHVETIKKHDELLASHAEALKQHDDLLRSHAAFIQQNEAMLQCHVEVRDHIDANLNRAGSMLARLSGTAVDRKQRLERLAGGQQ